MVAYRKTCRRAAVLIMLIVVAYASVRYFSTPAGYDRLNVPSDSKLSVLYTAKRQDLPADKPKEFNYSVEDVLLGEKALPCVMVPPVVDCQTIHIAIKSQGYTESQSVALLVKSILVYRHNPLHLHFLVDSVSSLILGELLRTWKLVGVKYTLYSVDNIEADLRFNTQSSHLWLHEVLPQSVQLVIVLDSDRVLAADVGELWSCFNTFKYAQIIGTVIANNGVKPGVTLLHLDHMRLLVQTPFWEKFKPAVTNLTSGGQLADKKQLEFVFSLPCEWNYQLTDSASQCPAKAKDIKIIQVSSSALPSQFWKAFLKVAHYDGNILRTPLAFTCIDDDDENSMDKDAESAEFRLVETYGDDLCKDYMREVIDTFRTHLYYLDFEYSSSDEPDVTLVTQLSISRIQGFESLCNNWPGPMSVAIYIADSDTRHFVSYILNSKVLAKRKNIAYHMVYEEGSLYPTNHLRNIAVRQVRTTHAFLLDVDFMPMQTLYDSLKKAVRNPDLDTQKMVLLVPAFETYEYNLVYPKTKQDLIPMYDKGTVFPFRMPIFAKGHAATDYPKWRNTSEPYKIVWGDGFEPYIVMKKEEIPKYNEIFMGYGKDKISQIMEVTARGYSFLVLPDTYIIHLPHAFSFDNQRFREDSSILRCMSLLLDDFTNSLLTKYGQSSLGGWTPKPIRKALH